MFGTRFKAAKCRTQLQICGPRIQIMRNKKEEAVKHMKREIAALLRDGKEPEALIQVERLLPEEASVTAYELLGMFCQTVCGKLTVVDATKICPSELKGPIASIIYAAPRCGDLTELQEVQKMFTAKYGKEFAAAASELRVDGGVDSRIIDALTVRPPSTNTKLLALKRIAREHHVSWDFEPEPAAATAAAPTVSAFRPSTPDGSNHGSNHPGSRFPIQQPSSPDRPQSAPQELKPGRNPEPYPGARDNFKPAAEFQPPPSPLSVLRTQPNGNEHFRGLGNKSPRGGEMRQPVGPQDSFSSSGSLATPRHERRFEPGERNPGTPRGTDEGRFDPGGISPGSDTGSYQGAGRSGPQQRAMAKALENAAQTVVALAHVLADYGPYEGEGPSPGGGNGRALTPPPQNGGLRVADWGENQDGGESEYRRPGVPGYDEYSGRKGIRAGKAFQQPVYETGVSRTGGLSGGRERNRGEENARERNGKWDGNSTGNRVGDRNGPEKAFGSPRLDNPASQLHSDRGANTWQGEKTPSPRRLQSGDDGGFREGFDRHAAAAARPGATPKRAESAPAQILELGRKRALLGTVFDSFEADSLSEGESRPPARVPGGSRTTGGLRPRSPVFGRGTTPDVKRSPSPNGDDLSFAFPPPPPLNLDLPSAKFPVRSTRVLPPPPKDSNDRGRYFKAGGSPRRGQSATGDPFDLPPASPDSGVDELAMRMGALRARK